MFFLGDFLAFLERQKKKSGEKTEVGAQWVGALWMGSAHVRGRSFFGARNQRPSGNRRRRPARMNNPAYTWIKSVNADSPINKGTSEKIRNADAPFFSFFFFFFGTQCAGTPWPPGT
jgi:hypothetical protein